MAAQKLHNRLEEAKLFNEIGNNFYDAGNLPQAILAYQKGLVIAQDIKDKKVIGITLGLIGACYQRQEQFGKAIATYQQALPFARQTNNQSLEEGVLRATGFIYLSQKKFDRAIEFYQQALLVVRKIGDPAKEWLVLQGLGNSYRFKGEPQKAVALYQQALKVAQSTWKDRPSEAESLETLLNLMATYNLIASSPDLKDASQVIEQSNLALQSVPEAIKLAKALKDLESEKRIREQESNAYTKIGDTYTNATELARAEEFIQKGLTIARESRNLLSERTALAMLTGVYVARGEYYKTIPLNERMLELSKKLQLPHLEVLDMLNLAQNYSEYGEVQKAIQVAQQVLQKVEQIDPTTISTNQQSALRAAKFYSLLNLNLYYKLIVDYDQALAIAQQNVKFTQTVPDVDLKVQALINLGETYSIRQNQPAALDSFQQALEIAQSAKLVSSETDALIKLSAAWLSQGNNVKALETAQKSIAVAQKGKTANQENLRLQQKAQNALINVYAAQGNYAKVLELLEVGIERDKQLANVRLQVTGSRYQLGDFYSSLGDYPRANEQFQQMLVKAQSIKYPLLEAVSWLLLAQTSLLQQSPQKALEFAQRGNSITRQDQMADLEMASNAVLATAYGELKDEQKAISAAQAGLERISKLNIKLLLCVRLDVGASIESSLLESSQYSSGAAVHSPC